MAGYLHSHNTRRPSRVLIAHTLWWTVFSSALNSSCGFVSSILDRITFFMLTMACVGIIAKSVRTQVLPSQVEFNLRLLRRGVRQECWWACIATRSRTRESGRDEQIFRHHGQDGKTSQRTNEKTRVLCVCVFSSFFRCCTKKNLWSACLELYSSEIYYVHDVWRWRMKQGLC